MMKIKCDISKIKPDQVMICMAIEGLYRQQSLERNCVLLSLDPLTFALDVNISEQQQQRLFAESVAAVTDGTYTGEIKNAELVLSPAEKAKNNATRSRRVRRDKSDGDIQ